MAIFAERLQVGRVEPPLRCGKPRNDVIHFTRGVAAADAEGMMTQMLLSETPPVGTKAPGCRARALLIETRLAFGIVPLLTRTAVTGGNPVATCAKSRRFAGHSVIWSSDQATGASAGWPLINTAPRAIDVPPALVSTERM